MMLLSYRPLTLIFSSLAEGMYSASKMDPQRDIKVAVDPRLANDART